MNGVTKLKRLMVSACDAVKQGHGDIARNLLEVAADVMEDVDPEEIETLFMTDAVNAVDVADAETEAESTDEELSPEVASRSFHDMLKGWDFNGTAG